MKPEHDRLMREIFEDDAARAETLRRGGRTLLRRRVMRRTRQFAGFCAVVVVAAAAWRFRFQPVPVNVATHTKPARPPEEKIRELSDEQLLALFPGTPVGLAKIGGKERLFFPRPGDEAKYITRVDAP